ncbi:3-oxoacyl-[acyl-carrier protein] reductase [Dissulfuribacter thermophilus]|uniref:3-oxoacyl-[acyl-carrier protein] reductase n=1 Tax=Dissulfuribacter thermophilus TaxID=1156395 RepID=A0A1B9F9J0_9BACT|nr:SDR family oxidoreductase [Dissulfuribacter thermophilus]OCC16586.1 3-oxoacyl-[acyl-carrier protein] reductase [Dissulfuribacter thermophilus]
MEGIQKTLEGRVAIVPGAIKGIGLEVAKALSNLGCRLVLPVYDWLDSLSKMRSELDAINAKYIHISADLRKERDVEKVIEKALEEFQRIDILINNIERGGWPIVHGPYTQEQWRLEWETTINAKWYLFNHSLQYLKRAQGVVVNISSIAGIVGRSGPASLVFNDCYSLSNRAIASLTQQWARLGAPEVRVNELQIGFVETRHGPGTRGWSVLTQEQRRSIVDHTLLGRIGTAQDVARAVVFLVRDATFMTGALLRLDGGYVLGGEKVSPMPEGIVSPEEPTFGGSIKPDSLD